MAFLSNRTVNLLNLYIACIRVLDQGLWIFGPIYLYEQGMPLSMVIGFLALLHLLRIPARPLAFVLVPRIGLKHSVMGGLVGLGIGVFLLGRTDGFDGWMLAYLLIVPACNGVH